MSDTILHHHDPSPFAEKVRLALGLKGLAWQSVQIPMVMPKPALTALTGGYRKTPVLQLGADVYCDTRRIAQELERRFAGPSLFPHGSEGTALALGYWADTALFQPGAALSMGTNDQIPAPVLADRMAFFDFLEDEDLCAPPDHFFAQFTAGLRQLDRMLADGRPWLLGDAASWADVACYSPVWMCRGNIAGGDELLAPLGRLLAWEARVAALGHGDRSELDAEAALTVAKEAEPVTNPAVADDAWPRLAAGTPVQVAPDDYGRDPTPGELLVLNGDQIAIVRKDGPLGRLVVHFPRAGYRVAPLPLTEQP
ncbi:glutathione S-transferase family protein [Pseudohaliea rubra]|uniref:Glutathione S-transferase n=1 Tax=Pseudohaliea rubra DSM 19751 TaxID=1265313 RepID=A0A095X2L5_9GAMM|nr:glutathione S-transferase family protein [Pseudohaliea rubra]KGE05084.1 Glutathione S-transferase [Pseudohaliea rubra DSM 19751]